MAASILDAVTDTAWRERWEAERTLLRQRFEDDRRKHEEQSKLKDEYEIKLKHANVNELSVLKLKEVEDARQNSRSHRIYYRDLRATTGWIELNHKVQLQSPLWQSFLRTPWDEAMTLDFVEGPHRMRQRLKKHREFVKIYKIDKQKYYQFLMSNPMFKQYLPDYFHLQQTNQKKKQKAITVGGTGTGTGNTQQTGVTNTTVIATPNSKSNTQWGMQQQGSVGSQNKKMLQNTQRNSETDDNKRKEGSLSVQQLMLEKENSNTVNNNNNNDNDNNNNNNNNNYNTANVHILVSGGGSQENIDYTQSKRLNQMHPGLFYFILFYFVLFCFV